MPASFFVKQSRYQQIAAARAAGNIGLADELAARPMLNSGKTMNYQATVSGPVVDLVLPLIRRAAAYKIKYRRRENLLRPPLGQVGFHPNNRDGQPPNGERCRQLAEDMFRLGRDRDEADAGGVVVVRPPVLPRLPSSV